MNDTDNLASIGRCNVLVTSASRKAPLLRAVQDAVRRIYPRASVIAGDIDPEAPTRYVADEFWRMPRIADEELPSLIKGCQERGIAVVLPTRDGELAFWARHSVSLFQEGVFVIVSKFEAIQRCLDKLQFARFGRQQGLPVIATGTTPWSVGPGPYVVKERFGAGAKGVGLNLSLDAAIKHAKKLTNPIFQTFVSGYEISIDAWLDCHGRIVGVVLRRRDLVIGGESLVTTTLSNEALEQKAVHALKLLDLRGPVVMQAIINDNGMHIIECNPRFGGASTIGIAAGLDSLYWSLMDAYGADHHPVFNRISGELRQVRLPTDMVFAWS